MHRKHATMAAVPVCALLWVARVFAGYGDGVGGLPLMKERQILTLTNACRMAPTEYRGAYVGNYAILDSAHYPAVAPLYLNTQLNKSAHDHALDMGDTCGTLSHSSCNGTAWNVRIRAYYTASQTIGENIAAGNADPFITMNQWIMDSPQGSTLPAADGSWCRFSGSSDSTQCDGHRANIMNGQYKEMGTGYAYGSSASAKYHPFWVQDFGGAKTSMANPVVSAAHFLRETGKTTLLAAYYDPSAKPPAEASVIIDGSKIALAVSMGKSWRGTYQAVVARGSACRNYYFAFVDGNGNSWRYPERGVLVTAGEGPCSREYIPAESLTVNSFAPSGKIGTSWTVTRVNNAVVTILVIGPIHAPERTEILDIGGKIVANHQWLSRGPYPGGEICERFAFPASVGSGIYFFVHCYSTNDQSVEKIGIFR